MGGMKCVSTYVGGLCKEGCIDIHMSVWRGGGWARGILCVSM